jgi:glycosyltransferase involved in cell wall biosynthesis
MMMGMSPRRVAYVVNVFPKLSETFIANELTELRQRGLDLIVLSLRSPQESVHHKFIDRSGLIGLTRYPPTEFRTALQGFRPEIIHAHFATEPTAAARLLSEELKIPFTFTAHGYDIRRKPPADFAARAKAARAVVTVSEANALHITDSFGVPPSHIRVIPCGVDTQRFQPRLAQPVKTDEATRVVCVARFAQVKNLPLLLRACAVLRDRQVRFRCVVVGDGPCRPQLETLRRELQLDSLVEFPGAADHDKVLQYWQGTSLAALSSESEGMPVCLMEAGACGIPAVATAVGGVPELIDNGVTGLLCQPGDPNLFADALQTLIEDPTSARRMGDAARRRIEQRFSLSGQVTQLLDLWKEILE